MKISLTYIKITDERPLRLEIGNKNGIPTGRLSEESGPFPFIAADHHRESSGFVMMRHPISTLLVPTVEWVRLSDKLNFIRLGLAEVEKVNLNIPFSVTKDAQPHEAALLREAESYYRPITSKSYGPQLWQFLRGLKGDDYEDMMSSLGRSPKRARDQMLKTRFICSQYEAWIKHEATYSEAAAHCCKHGLDVTAESLRKYMKRHLKVPDLKTDPGARPDTFK